MWINLKYLCICHVETIQISPHLSYGEIWNFSPSTMWRKFRFLHRTDVGKSEMSPRLSCVWFLQYAILCNMQFLQFTLFCSEISFVAIYAVCRKISWVAIYAFFMSNFWDGNCAGVKNDKYEVWEFIASILLNIWILNGSGDYLRCFVAFWFCREIYGKKSE